MSVDIQKVKHIAQLSRLALSEQEAKSMCNDLNAILEFVAQLQQVDVEGVKPIASVLQTKNFMRADEVDDGNCAKTILANAPKSEDNFFIVPKVVE